MHVDASDPVSQPDRAEAFQAGRLVDRLHDGFYLLLLVRGGREPRDPAELFEQIQIYLADFESAALRDGIAAEDVHEARYAFCATADEIVLNATSSALREHWSLRPLQLENFGDQLAGEHFFDKLERLRAQGAERMELLEVYHLCLASGFQGRYARDGGEKLAYLVARLGDEIIAYRGRRPDFAPHWAPPDTFSHTVRRDMPLWVVGAACALFCALTFKGIQMHLESQTASVLAEAEGLISATPDTAHITITLP